MDEKERRAVQDYQRWLLAKFPQQIERIVLFGSRARGDARPGADVDLLIVLRGNAQPVGSGFYALGATDPLWRDAVGRTFDLLLEYGVEISPTILHENEYRESTPLLAHVRQEGVELWKRTG
ncbi:MAG TPA: nucleotidyltransferase domain-containing protein [Anaerolineae bacterium]|nr:nucleotidyltransferase domain-containing protein [Anaerolineae bacterium]